MQSPQAASICRRAAWIKIRPVELVQDFLVGTSSAPISTDFRTATTGVTKSLAIARTRGRRVMVACTRRRVPRAGPRPSLLQTGRHANDDMLSERAPGCTCALNAPSIRLADRRSRPCLRAVMFEGSSTGPLRNGAALRIRAMASYRLRLTERDTAARRLRAGRFQWHGHARSPPGAERRSARARAI